jgi:hypothetical protein
MNENPHDDLPGEGLADLWHADHRYPPLDETEFERVVADVVLLMNALVAPPWHEQIFVYMDFTGSRSVSVHLLDCSVRLEDIMLSMTRLLEEKWPLWRCVFVRDPAHAWGIVVDHCGSTARFLQPRPGFTKAHPRLDVGQVLESWRSSP